MALLRNVSRIYLILVPFVAAALGFGVGRVDPGIYIPVFLVNLALMLTAVWQLRRLPAPATRDTRINMAACLLIIGWLIMPLLAGFGPPPSTAEAWTRLAGEQQLRYAMLVVVGITSTAGFILLSSLPRIQGEKTWSTLTVLVILIALPLYLLNMILLGGFTTTALAHFSGTANTGRPDWYLAMKSVIVWLNMISVSLIYLSTALLAQMVKKVGWLSASAANGYTIASIVALVFSSIPPSAPMPWAVFGYIVAVPAITWLPSYLLGVQLMGSEKAVDR